MNKLLASLLISLSLVACGGGGGEPEHPAIQVAQNAPVVVDTPKQDLSLELTEAQLAPIKAICDRIGGFKEYRINPNAKYSEQWIVIDFKCGMDTGEFAWREEVLVAR